MSSSSASTVPPVPIAWTQCDEYECATFDVPLDHGNPFKGNISLALRRNPARSPDRRIGTLFINPGGPGGSGYDFVADIEGLLPLEVQDRFDVLGFDPRGVARSSPAVDCSPGGAEFDLHSGIDPSPDSAREQEELIDAARRFVEGCAPRTGALLNHMSTVDVAKDLDLLRAAVGDEKLTFYGGSYGTVIGAMYAELFPTRVRALVLDAAVDMSLDGNGLNRGQAASLDRALSSFLSWCRPALCEWRPAGAKGQAVLLALMKRIDAAPLPAGGRQLDPGDAYSGIAGALTIPRRWPELGAALAAAERGDGTKLQSLADQNSTRPDDRFSNQAEAGWATICVDAPVNRDLAFYGAEAARVARTSPVFGAALVWEGLVCALWPIPPARVPSAVRAPGTPPIVVIGTTNDPSTSYEWSEAMARQLPQGKLITYVGDGHGALGRSLCVDTAVGRYLIDLTEPAPGLRC